MRRSPGPGHPRVLRALAYCYLRRGLYQDALEIVEAALRRDTNCAMAAGSEPDAEREGGVEERHALDAAMLMFRADALVI